MLVHMNKLIDLHNSLSDEKVEVEIKKTKQKRKTVNDVRKDYDNKILELKKENQLLKDLLKFYLKQDILFDTEIW